MSLNNKSSEVLELFLTGCIKKMSYLAVLICRQPSIGFLNVFFLQKIKIHMQILSTTPFLCNFWG